MTSTRRTTRNPVRRATSAAAAVVVLAVATALVAPGPPASAAGPSSGRAAPQPRLKVTQTVSPTTHDRAGQVLTWTSTVTNFGDTALQGLAVTDSLAAVPTRTCASVGLGGGLAAGASTTCTATSTVTQADLDGGATTTDTVTASATTSPQQGDVKVSASATASSRARVSADLTVTTSASPTTVTHLGQQVAYRVAVANRGNQTLHGLLVSAPFSGLSALACAPVPQGGALAPARTTTCSATRTVGEAQLRDGALDDTASAEASTPGGTRVVGSDAVSVTSAVPLPVVADQSVGAVAGGRRVSLPGATTAGPGDPGGPAIDPSRTVLVGADLRAPSFGKVAHTAHADWTVHPDGSVTVRPSPQYYGSGGDGVDYRVYDVAGRSAVGHLHATVRPGAAAGAPTTATTPQGRPVTVDVLSHDDPGQDADGGPGAFDGASLRLVGLDWGPEGDWSRYPVDYVDHGRRISLFQVGDYTAGADGRITFTPVPGYAGTPPPVYYTADSTAGSPETSWLTVTVSPGPQAAPVFPGLVATDDHAVTIRRLPVLLAGQANDPGARMDGTTFPADQLAHLPVGSRLVGSTLLEVAGEGTYDIRNLDGIYFTPAPGFRRPATTPVRYEISDWSGVSKQATLTVTVLQGAVAHPDTASTIQGRPVTVDVRTDDDLGPSLTEAPLTTADRGSVRFTTTSQPVGSTLGRYGSTLTVPDQGVYRVEPGDGTITFTPAGPFSGAASPVNVATTVRPVPGSFDGPWETVVAKLQVTVARVAPLARADSAGTSAARPVVVDVLANDAAGAPEVPLVASSVRLRATGLPSGAVLSQDGERLVLPGRAAFLVAGDGSITVVPLGAAPDALPAVTYDVADANGNRAASTVTVRVQA